MSRPTRALSRVPRPILGALLLVGIAQFVYIHQDEPRLRSDFQPLQPPLAAHFYQAAATSSDRLLAHVLLLDLQLHDSQRGRHFNYRQLDFNLLSEWLWTVYQIAPQSGYPAFLASRVYSSVADKAKLPILIDLIEKLFRADPELHWRRMTEACLLAKHRLGDLRRALQLARQVAELPGSMNLPHWARDMRIILLDELNEFESARILISSMLESGEIEDPDELRFLRSRLLKIQQSLSSREQSG